MQLTAARCRPPSPPANEHRRLVRLPRRHGGRALVNAARRPRCELDARGQSAPWTSPNLRRALAPRCRRSGPSHGNIAGLAPMRDPSIFGRIQAEWQRFIRSLPGERFIEHYERHQAHTSDGLRALTYFATVFCVGMAIVLFFKADPAWPYWLLGVVLLPGESRRVAVVLDRIERALRSVLYPRPQYRGYEVIETEILPTPPRPRSVPRPARTTLAPQPRAAAPRAAAPRPSATDPRRTWLNTPAGGAPRPARTDRTQKIWTPGPPRTRTPVPRPIDRRTPTPS